ncbi:L-threonylcarbamoyladenylate synthase [Cohnella faecalis]|uniref:Threonylcarbamoyl-AMP synthase n=1 Tax=Cohnella faecalis TaxID=2315694 RepID=A0A398CMD6_9BACL|nr:L-threonylcarbamoyladenylate synthase [Cohnella faecalis]RIE01978.1 threonylcarbamoyl-AMP synthase [Cohnella faecalis]
MTTTQYWTASSTAERGEADLKEAAAALAAGGVVAFPTETVYGLGGDARSTEAVGKIFAAKGRPSDNPLIVHIADEADVESLCERVGEIERTLMRIFWPGPLTLVLPVRPGAVSPLVTAGLDTVAVRLPEHRLARDLIAAAGCPLAAPSANRSGRPSPTEARHVQEDLDGRIDGVLDGGAAGVGLESTVVRVLDGIVHVLRPGGVTAEHLQAAIGDLAEVRQSHGTEETNPVVAADDSAADSGISARELAEERLLPELRQAAEPPRSPGVKYAHYAPRGEMLLVTGDPERMVAEAQRAADEARRQGRRVGVLACAEHEARYRAEHVLRIGSRAEPATAARALYAALRQCDELGLDYIVAEGFPEAGIGAALMNRLRKAAGGREHRV